MASFLTFDILSFLLSGVGIRFYFVVGGLENVYSNIATFFDDAITILAYSSCLHSLFLSAFAGPFINSFN